MNEKKLNVIAISFIAFVILIIIALSAVIYSTPVEVVSGTAGNYTANLANGGYVIEDEGFLFYTLPDEKGIYRAETDNSAKSEKISDKGDGFLQVSGNTYYFIDDNMLCSSNWSGENFKIIRDYAEKPLVVGSLIFYLDESGNLKKYSMQTGEESVIISASKDVKPVKEFADYYKKIYYIDNEGNIKKISFDGDDDKIFITADAEKLSVDGQFLFYIEKGKLFSAMIKDNEILKAEITEVSEYAVFGSYIVYTDGKKTYYAEANMLFSDSNYKPKIICESAAKGISIDDENFYFFTEKGLERISHDGSTIVKIK